MADDKNYSNKDNNNRNNQKDNHRNQKDNHREQKDNPNKNNTKKPSLCEVSKKCGGCQYIDLPYKEQLARKQRQAEKLLKRFGKVKPIIGMENPSHYRNKVHAVFDFQRGKGIVSGIYK